MIRARVIPVLLLQESGLCKTLKFKNPKYVGDPLNAVRIFNEKYCDEIIVLDILASKNKKPINYKLIEEIATECFMPLAYGGGISNLSEIEKIMKLGVEKVILNSAVVSDPEFMIKASEKFASSTLVASVDIKKNIWGKNQVFSHSGRKVTVTDPIEFIKLMEKYGCGEIMVNMVDRDGVMDGYDIEFLRNISSQIPIPVIACGGCGRFEDIKDILEQTQVSAAAAGSFFVFHGKHRAVLISYPEPRLIDNLITH